MSFALSSPVSYPLIFAVVGWAVGLFCGFGLTSGANAMSIAALTFGSIAVASAAYLILDLSSPVSRVLSRFARSARTGAWVHVAGSGNSRRTAVAVGTGPAGVVERAHPLKVGKW